jgi:hypothetical protein
MKTPPRPAVLAALAAALSLPVALPVVLVAADADAEGFISLFDGKSLDGWKVSEHQEAVRVEDGAIVTNGERAHAFYAGEVNGGKFDDFELKLDVMTKENSNGGVYIHTEFQESGWPAKGYEIQVNNTHSDWRKSGGLYAIVDNREPFKDGEWMSYHIVVKGKQITVSVDGKQLVDYTEKEDEARDADKGGRWLIDGGGTIALQAHDPGSTVYYKNIRIKPLAGE